MVDKASDNSRQEGIPVDTKSSPPMGSSHSNTWKSLQKVCNYSFRLVTLILLLVTLYVVLGRQMMPLVIEGQKSRLEVGLIDVLGTQVTLGKLEGDWLRFSPVIILQDLNIPFTTVAGSGQINSQQLGSLRVELDMPASLLQRKLVISEVSIADVKLHLVEGEGGTWSAAGFSGGSGGNREPVLDFLLDTSRLELSESTLILHRIDGSIIELNNIYGKIINFIGRHQFQSQFRLSSAGQPLQLQLELLGDPRVELSGSGFLEIVQADFSELLAIRSPATAELEAEITSLMGSAQLWFDFDDSSILQLQGGLSDLKVEGSLGESEVEVDINGGSVDITLLQNDEDQWQLWLEGLQFDWHNRPWVSNNIYAELDFSNDAALLEISTESIDVNGLVGLLEVVTLPEAGRKVLDDLQPSGYLRNIHLSTDLLGNYPNGFRLSANLENVAVGGWNGAPSGQGINAYVQANKFSGFVELDSKDFYLHLPEVFAQGWHYDSINSRVHWSVRDDKVTVNSSVIDVQNDDINGRVQFELNNVRNELGDWDTDLSLLVGIIEFDISKKSVYLPILEDIKEPMAWLDEALVSGKVINSGFIFRGITAGNQPEGSSTVQTFYHVENAELKFLPAWPELTETNGFVQVSNNDIDISIDSSVLNNIALAPSTAKVREESEGNDRWLSITSRAQASTERGLDFIRTTPIGDDFNEFIANWKGTGEVGVNVQLEIPLNNDELQSRIEVVVQSVGSSIEMPDYSLTIDAIDGDLIFTDVDGFNAENLSASMFGFPVMMNIESYSRQLPGNMLVESGTLIESTGHVTTQALLAQPFLSDFVKDTLGFSSGEINYQAALNLFSSENADGVLSHLSIHTDLFGMEINLPEPFSKRPEELKPLNIDIDYLSSSEVLTASYSNNFYAQLQLEDGVVGWGQLYFGMLNQDFSIRQANVTEPGLLISGDLSYFDYDAWEEASEAFTDDETDTDVNGYIRLIDLNIGQLDILDQELMDINTQVRRSASSWLVYLENDVVKGELEFPDDLDKSYEIHLDYLHVPEIPSETESDSDDVDEDMFAEIDPNELPDMNVSLADFRIGEQNLGQWSFASRANSRGISISDFKINMADAQVLGLNDENGAELEWLYREGQHSTYFSGRVEAGDLANVLPEWGYNANIETSSAQFLSSVEWLGSPATFSLKTAVGEIDVDIEDGRFVDVNTGGVKLLGVLNFDSIVRRLKLDFSDLYETGLAFDEISGSLLVNNGIIRTKDKFLIDGPSSTINVDGELNLVNETVNADLLVSIPISQNAAVVAGLVGAWPVAVGAYVAGKIFRDQFAGLTAVRYRLEGPWAGLEAGFESAEGQVIEIEESIEAGNE